MSALLVLLYLLYVLGLPGVLAVRILRVEARLEAVLLGGMVGLVVVPLAGVQAAAITGAHVTPGLVAGVVTSLNGAMAGVLWRRARRQNQT